MRLFWRGGAAALLVLMVTPLMTRATTEDIPRPAVLANRASDAIVRLAVGIPGALVTIPRPPALHYGAPAPSPPRRHERERLSETQRLRLEIGTPAVTPTGPAPAAQFPARAEGTLEIAANFKSCACRVKLDPGAIELGRATHGAPLPGDATRLVLPDPILRVSWAL